MNGAFARRKPDDEKPRGYLAERVGASRRSFEPSQDLLVPIVAQFLKPPEPHIITIDRLVRRFRMNLGLIGLIAKLRRLIWQAH